jgi:hypothetical protein
MEDHKPLLYLGVGAAAGAVVTGCFFSLFLLAIFSNKKNLFLSPPQPGS